MAVPRTVYLLIFELKFCFFLTLFSNRLAGQGLIMSSFQTEQWFIYLIQTIVRCILVGRRKILCPVILHQIRQRHPGMNEQHRNIQNSR